MSSIPRILEIQKNYRSEQKREEEGKEFISLTHSHLSSHLGSESSCGHIEIHVLIRETGLCNKKNTRRGSSKFDEGQTSRGDHGSFIGRENKARIKKFFYSSYNFEIE